jgi:hypothetical protein
MATSAADRNTSQELRDLEERTRTAWEDYRASISELAGDVYEEIEPASWDRLQQALLELADERERLVGAGTASSADQD